MTERKQLHFLAEKASHVPLQPSEYISRWAQFNSGNQERQRGAEPTVKRFCDTQHRRYHLLVELASLRLPFSSLCVKMKEKSEQGHEREEDVQHVVNHPIIKN